MKKNKFLTGFLLALACTGVIMGCDDDETPPGTGIDFATIESTVQEPAGSITIPLRNGTVSAADITFKGSAVEGEDFELAEVNSEGIQLNIINDEDFEVLETIKVELKTTGNNIHTVHLFSNCEDLVGIEDALSHVPSTSGRDVTAAGLGFAGNGAVTIQTNEEGNYTIKGLNHHFISAPTGWNEEILEEVPVVLTMGADGAFTIEDQYIFTTLYDGDEYEYHIVGTGQVDVCSNTLTIDYEILQDGFGVGAYLHSQGLMADEIFKATFGLPF